jgi:phosphoribosylaminoimidazole-succinocarboxamide synthase
MTDDAVHESDIPELELLGRGKVRDIYAVDRERLLIVTTDRISAFDVVMDDPIPGKGIVLNAISDFWFARTAGIVANHLTHEPAERLLEGIGAERYASRSAVVRRLHPLPFEAVVRGYLLGSGWSDYQRSGTVCGIALPRGLRLAERLEHPLFTPASKAAAGAHDENISMETLVDLVGREVAERVRSCALELYRYASAVAAERGIIIADTKFEFAMADGQLVLIDEVLTPDSSRFWPAQAWQPGHNPPSFDKQFLRDFLSGLDWDRSPPPPRLPAEVIAGTRERYRQALELLTGPTATTGR